MKKVFRSILVLVSTFFISKKTVAKEENPLIAKANLIQQNIFKEYNTNNDNQTRLISYLDDTHNLGKIEVELSEKIEVSNWVNWNTWNTWDTWDTWSTWDNWGNWFDWTNI